MRKYFLLCSFFIPALFFNPLYLKAEYRKLTDKELELVTARASSESLKENYDFTRVNIIEDYLRNKDRYIETKTSFSGTTAKINIQFDLTHEVSWDTFYYTGNEPGGAYASICDVYYKMKFFTPDDGLVSAEAGYGPPLTNPYGPNVSKIRIESKKVGIMLEEARIGAIRIGYEPGGGESFGSLLLGGAEMELSAIIEIWPR